MARRMSFAKTIRQIKEKTKTETRRLGWNCVKVGDVIQAVNKTMGFKKGEKPELLDLIVVTKTWREPLDRITQEGCAAEGFPELMPEEFVAMFCDLGGCAPDTEIRVIQFEYVPF